MSAADIPAGAAAVAEPVFGGATDFAIGLEQEVFLIEPSTLDLVPTGGAIAAAVTPPVGRVQIELHATQVELTTPACAGVEGGVAVLADLRASVRAAGAVMMAAGLHPMARPEPAVSPHERYVGVVDLFGEQLFRSPEAALHVHIGMPDAQTAIRCFNGLREQAPLLLALCAGSAFREGRDTRWASARMMQLRSYPRWEVPRAFVSWDDYASTMLGVMTAAGLQDYTKVWWLIRPHPQLGTIEVRIMDSTSSLRVTAGMVALVRALAANAAERPPVRPIPREALEESLFQAARFGLDARLVTSDGSAVAARELGAAVVREARARLRALEPDDPLDEIERIVREGNPADGQRAVYRQTGMDGLLRHLVTETTAPLTASSGS